MKDRARDNFNVVEIFREGEPVRLWNNRDNPRGTTGMEDANRKKALSAALSQIEKQFGKGSVMRLGEHPANNDIEVVSTGSLGLDVALGIGVAYTSGLGSGSGGQAYSSRKARGSYGGGVRGDPRRRQSRRCRVFGQFQISVCSGGDARA
jgi:hypothetical protein